VVTVVGIAHQQSVIVHPLTAITTVDIGHTAYQSSVLFTVHPTDRITAEDMEALAGTVAMVTDVAHRSESVVAVSESASGSNVANVARRWDPRSGERSYIANRSTTALQNQQLLAR